MRLAFQLVYLPIDLLMLAGARRATSVAKVRAAFMLAWFAFFTAWLVAFVRWAV